MSELKVLFEEKSDIWMRIVSNGFNAWIEVCPNKQIINGLPVWVNYPDSAPANKLLNWVKDTIGTDMLVELPKLKDEVKKLTKENKELIESNKYYRNRLDTIDGELKYLKKKQGLLNEEDFIRELESHPYR